MTQETRKRRVVVAEDDNDTRAAICELVRSLGVEVVEASSGGDLVILLTDSNPTDLIITDLKMPWMSGAQVALSVRRLDLNMPIIFVTAYADDKFRTQVERLGSCTLLEKPFKPEELLSLVQSKLLAYSTVKG